MVTPDDLLPYIRRHYDAAMRRRAQGLKTKPHPPASANRKTPVVHVVQNPPWSVRRRDWLKRIAAAPMGLCINRKWCKQWKYEPDLRRLVKEGYAALSGKEGTLRSSYRYLRLTDAGRALIETP